MISGAWTAQGTLHNNVNLHNLHRPLFVTVLASGDNRSSIVDYDRNLVENHAFQYFVGQDVGDIQFIRNPFR